jgi:hypothetical protein
MINKSFIYSFILMLLISFLYPKLIFALPSENEADKRAGHSDLTEMSSKIKQKVNDADFNRSIGSNITIMQESNVSEDDAVGGGLKGARHFYRSDGTGYLGFFQTAKDRASDLYNSIMKYYCTYENYTDADAWNDFGSPLHLLQDMSSSAHSLDVSHIAGDYYEQYVQDNWELWSDTTIIGYDLSGETPIAILGPLPDEGKIKKPSGEYYSGLKEYLEDLMSDDPEDPNDPYMPYSSDDYQFSGIDTYMESLARTSRGYNAYDPNVYYESMPYEEIRNSAETLLPMAMLYGAGFIDTLWDDMQHADSGGMICKVTPQNITNLPGKQL